MNLFFGAIVTGITAFTATNIDDLVILMLFFAQVDSKLKPWHIFAGQYLGFTALILTSLPGFFGGLMIPRPWIGLMGFVPIFIGINHLINPEDDDDEVQGISTDFAVKEKSSLLAKLSHLMKPQIFQVGAVTFANGGDNIGIYVPLFASCNLPSFLTILIVFYIMIAVWCYSAYQFTRHPQVAKLLTRYTHAIVPFVLIALGLFILWESKSYQLLGVKL